MYNRRIYTIGQLKSLRHEYRVHVDESPFLGAPALRYRDGLEPPQFWYPELLPPGSKIIKLRAGEPLPPGSVPLIFPIEERSLRRTYQRRMSSCPRPGDSGYKFKYAPFFEPFMSKESKSGNVSGTDKQSFSDSSGQNAPETSSESSSDSIQIQLPPQ